MLQEVIPLLKEHMASPCSAELLQQIKQLVISLILDQLKEQVKHIHKMTYTKKSMCMHMHYMYYIQYMYMYIRTCTCIINPQQACAGGLQYTGLSLAQALKLLAPRNGTC